MTARTPDAEPLLTPAEVATMFRVDRPGQCGGQCAGPCPVLCPGLSESGEGCRIGCAGTAKVVQLHILN